MTRKNTFSEEWPWFNFNNLGLALGMALTFYANVTKEWKLKARKFEGIIPTFVEVTVKEVVAGSLNRVNIPKK